MTGLCLLCVGPVVLISIFVLFGQSLKCHDNPCLSCQDCTRGENYVVKPGACDARMSNRSISPGKPSNVQTCISYLPDGTSRFLVSNIFVTLSPPRDVTINIAEGFQIETTSITTGSKHCLTHIFPERELTDDYQVEFCLSGLNVSTYLLEISTLPLPSYSDANTVRQYAIVPSSNRPLNSQDAFTKVPFAYEVSNNSQNALMKIFLYPESGIYEVTLVRRHDLRIVRHDRVKSDNLTQKFVIFSHICNGTYTIQIQPQHRSVDHLTPCPIAESADIVILINSDTSCTEIENFELPKGHDIPVCHTDQNVQDLNIIVPTLNPVKKQSSILPIALPMTIMLAIVLVYVLLVVVIHRYRENITRYRFPWNCPNAVSTIAEPGQFSGSLQGDEVINNFGPRSVSQQFVYKEDNTSVTSETTETASKCLQQQERMNVNNSDNISSVSV